MNHSKVSLKSRLWFAFLLPVLIFALILFIGIRLNVEILFTIPLALILSLLFVVFSVNYFFNPFASLIRSIETGLNCFRDEDFSVNIAEYDFKEFQIGVDTYNQLSKILRSERMELHQRELLLDTIIQNTPMAIILTSGKDEIIYGNVESKKLLKQNKKIEGQQFMSLVNNLPADLARASIDKTPGLYTNTDNDQREVYYLVVENFNLNAQTHYLYLFKNMTSEVHKEEVQVWKKVIRLISHELNNSLAPIQSLTRSAQKRIAQTSNDELLTDIFETIERRASHLHQFIDKYAKFSRLPNPIKQSVELVPFISDLETICQISIEHELTTRHFEFDRTQIEQVLINLIKNARESGSDTDQISLSVVETAKSLQFKIRDRGKGMSHEQLSQSMLPFYTTKSGGTGLGLALSKEVINAHNGQLKIYNRANGGLCVEFSLPTK